MEKEPFYKKVATVIKEEITFDMRSDTEGFPTIQWLIARSLLKDYPEFERFQLINSYVTLVKNNLNAAMNSLESEGVVVYRSIPKGNKNILFITTNPDYMEARQADYDRQKNRVLANLKTFGENIALKYPDKLSLVGGDTKRLTNKLESTI
jgi:hypothetical protein